MSVVIELSDAVAASINAGAFDPPVTAERSHLPIFDLGTVGDAIKVSVVPRSLTVAAASRSSGFFDAAIDIGVQRRVDPDDPAQVDALHGLVEQVGDRLRLSPLETLPGAQWIASEHDPLLAAEHLERLSVFTSVLTVTYRLTR